MSANILNNLNEILLTPANVIKSDRFSNTEDAAGCKAGVCSAEGECASLISIETVTTGSFF